MLKILTGQIAEEESWLITKPTTSTEQQERHTKKGTKVTNDLVLIDKKKEKKSCAWLKEGKKLCNRIDRWQKRL